MDKYTKYLFTGAGRATGKSLLQDPHPQISLSLFNIIIIIGQPKHTPPTKDIFLSYNELQANQSTMWGGSICKISSLLPGLGGFGELCCGPVPGVYLSCPESHKTMSTCIDKCPVSQ